MKIWKNLSKASTILFISTLVVIFIYSQLFIKNGVLDFNDKIFFGGVIVVFLFVGIISSVNLTSQNGKKITFRSVIGAIVLFVVFLLYRAAVEF